MSENELSEKIIIDEIIIRRLKRNAGIIECVSQRREMYPSGIVTLKKSKMYLFKNAVMELSKLYIGKVPFSIR